MNNKLKKVREVILKLDIKASLLTFYNDIIKMPLYLIIYPIKGYDEFKREKQSKGYVAVFYLSMLILAKIIAFNANGFLVNKNSANDFNLFLTIILVLFPVIIFVVANWATTALMDGKGSMTEIFRVVCYSFFPYVWLGLLSTIISNYITVDEKIFYTFLQSVGIIVTIYMMFFGLLGIHEYGLFKTIMMIVFTIVAIAVILFIILLFLSLFQQVWAFLQSVYGEFVMRFLICII